MSYTLEFLPAAAPAAEKVQTLEAALLRKRGELQSFEGEFRQARPPDFACLCSNAVSLKAVDGLGWGHLPHFCRAWLRAHGAMRWLGPSRALAH